jgi:hypothetical protein
MRVAQDLNSFVEIIAHVQCSVDGKKIYIFRVYHIRILQTKIGRFLNNHCQVFPTTRNLQIRVHVYRPVVETD